MTDTDYRRDVRRGNAILALTGAVALLAGAVGAAPTPTLAGALAGVCYLESTAHDLLTVGGALIALGAVGALLWRVPAFVARLGERLR